MCLRAEVVDWGCTSKKDKKIRKKGVLRLLQDARIIRRQIYNSMFKFLDHS